MTSATRTWVAPAYLFICLILGGSAQGVWNNMILELAGVMMIASLAIKPSSQPVSTSARLLFLLAIAAVLLVLIQLIPMPPATWSGGVRGRIAADYGLLGQKAPWLPLSLTPAGSLDALLKLIPPLAMFGWIVRQREYEARQLAGALLAGTMSGVLLGTLQVAGGSSDRWYPYPETNIGFAVGFFANANHMADLLVISLPFIAALIASDKHENRQRRSASLLILTSISLVLLTGIAINHSLAALGLAVPVAFASAAIVVPPRNPWRRIAVAIAGLTVVFSILALSVSSIGATKFGQDARTSVQSRAQILSTTERAVRDFMPLGSGLGSFVQVYRLYESPDNITTEYVIHAHDDYAELALELGLPGILLILAFLAWWIHAVWSVWKGARGNPFARAASIASATVLIHSVVDYPLRTIAIGTSFGMFMALLADRNRPVFREPNELRPARHIVIR